MKIEINLEKQHVVLILAFMMVCTGIIYVGAQSGNNNNPAYFGDGTGEIDWSEPIDAVVTAQKLNITSGWRGIQMTNDDQQYDFIVGSSDNGRRFGIFDDTANTYRFVIRGDTGNTGMGTGSPQEKLHVAGNVRA